MRNKEKSPNINNISCIATVCSLGKIQKIPSRGGIPCVYKSMSWKPSGLYKNKLKKSLSCYLKGVLPHSHDDILEKYLVGEGVAVVNYRLRIWTIPAVDLQTAAAFPQSAASHKMSSVKLMIFTNLTSLSPYINSHSSVSLFDDTIDAHYLC